MGPFSGAYAGGRALNPLNATLGSGLEPPPPPRPDSDPRGSSPPPKPAPKGANFSGFLTPCGAESWGGGGAPPTTLILLRNQLAALQSVLGRATSPNRPPFDASRPFRKERICALGEKNVFFFVVVVSWGRWT